MAAERVDEGVFRRKCGVLFHEGKSDGEDVANSWFHRVAREVLRPAHAAPLAGHFGKRKRVGKILPRFY